MISKDPATQRTTPRCRSLSYQDIQSVARQCLEALRFLHEDMRLTHTDLKLENAPWRPWFKMGGDGDEWIWRLEYVGTLFRGQNTFSCLTWRRSAEYSSGDGSGNACFYSQQSFPFMISHLCSDMQQQRNLFSFVMYLFSRCPF